MDSKYDKMNALKIAPTIVHFLPYLYQYSGECQGIFFPDQYLYMSIHADSLVRTISQREMNHRNRHTVVLRLHHTPHPVQPLSLSSQVSKPINGSLKIAIDFIDTNNIPMQIY